MVIYLDIRVYFAETWGIKRDIALKVHRHYSQFTMLYHDYAGGEQMGEAIIEMVEIGGLTQQC